MDGTAETLEKRDRARVDGGWCNGRVELPDHARLLDWLWHPAPLHTWDGTRRRREG